jgi:hypothetical protein
VIIETDNTRARARAKAQEAASPNGGKPDVRAPV